MVVVFAVFVTFKFVFIQQLGLGLAVAVFIDATLIRSVLLPATMTLLGDWNWWLPRWLRLAAAGHDRGRGRARAGGREPAEAEARIRGCRDARGGVRRHNRDPAVAQGSVGCS